MELNPNCIRIYKVITDLENTKVVKKKKEKVNPEINRNYRDTENRMTILMTH